MAVSKQETTCNAARGARINLRIPGEVGRRFRNEVGHWFRSDLGPSDLKSATRVGGGKCSTAGRCTALCSSGTTSGGPMPA